MIAIVIIVAVAVLVLILVGLVSSPGNRAAPQGHELQDIQAGISSIDMQLDTDHRAARRAMNAAAGQSWRNLVER